MYHCFIDYVNRFLVEALLRGCNLGGAAVGASPDRFYLNTEKRLSRAWCGAASGERPLDADTLPLPFVILAQAGLVLLNLGGKFNEGLARAGTRVSSQSRRAQSAFGK